MQPDAIMILTPGAATAGAAGGGPFAADAAAVAAAAGASAGESYVLDLLVILATSALVAIVMQRMRLAVIPAYIIAGVIVGPGALRIVRSSESLEAVSNLAIILLMFGIGLHLQLNVLGRGVWRLVSAGVGSCLFSILVGWPVAMRFGLSAPQALTMCMALSLSSTAVVLRLIADRGQLRHASGRLAISILVVQDLLTLLMLAALPAIARWNGTGGELITRELIGESDETQTLPGWGPFLAESAVRVGGITVLIILGKLALPRLLREAARGRSGEVMMIASVAIALGAGVATQLLGFSMELGAFLAGFLLAATQFRHQLSGQIAPLRDLFLAVFFTTLGMRLDPVTLAQWWWVILLGGAAMSALKVLSIGLISWLLGATGSLAVVVGFMLAQAGEFSLVLIGAATALGIFSETVAANAIAIVVISLVITPGLIQLGRRSALLARTIGQPPWVRAAIGDAPPQEHAAAAAASGRHAIIAGFGPIGRIMAQSLDDAGIAYTIVELNPDTARGVAGKGKAVVFGDISNAEVLESAGLQSSDALILTMPDELAVFAAVAIARRRRPEIFIIARLGLTHHAHMAIELGANHVVIEEMETARAMKDALMRHVERA